MCDRLFVCDQMGYRYQLACPAFSPLSHRSSSPAIGTHVRAEGTATLHIAATNQRLLACPSPPSAPTPRRACPPALHCCSHQPALSNKRIRRDTSLSDDVSLDQTVSSLNH